MLNQPLQLKHSSLLLMLHVLGAFTSRVNLIASTAALVLK
jgi:hypothetical protein